jgi:hypothetical protein
MAILTQSRLASAPARRQGFARSACRLTPPLTAAGAPAQIAVSSCLTQLLRSLTTGSDTKFLTTPTDAPGTDAPTLMVLNGKQQEVVNYTQDGQWLKTDRLFKRAMLVSGVGANRQLVHIEAQ